MCSFASLGCGAAIQAPSEFAGLGDSLLDENPSHDPLAGTGIKAKVDNHSEVAAERSPPLGKADPSKSCL